MSDLDKLFADMPSNPSLSYEPEAKLRERARHESEQHEDEEGLPRKADLMTWSVAMSPGAEDPGSSDERTKMVSPEDMIQTVQQPPSGIVPKPPPAPAKPRPSTPAPNAGEVGVQYELKKVIGAGGFGEVWEAHQRSLGRSVAVKRVRRELRERTPRETRGAMAEMTFRQEAAITGLLEHPNIVPIHDLGIDADGSPMLAMKLVRGEPWDRLIAKDFREMLPADFIAKHLQILVHMTQAVAFAHSRGIVHRDLKPSQVMTGEFGEVLLMDWGLAVHFDRRRRPRDNQQQPAIELLPEKLPTIQTASNPAGTPALMAPEQTLNDATKIGFWTDIYLLGGTLYYLLTGTFPHMADTSRDAFRLAQLGEVKRPEVRAPERDVPPELSDLCMEALAKDPKARVPSAIEFLKRIQDFLSGAGKRRESRALTAEVRENLEHGRMSYDGMANLLDTLNRAKSLWPDNPELPELFDQVLNLYARQALAAGDLNLAKFEADQIREGEMREKLLHDITEARKRVKAESRQHKLLSFAFIVLLVLIVAVWSVFNFMMTAERNDLRRSLEKQGELSTVVTEKQKELEAIYALSEGLRTEPLEELYKLAASLVPAATRHPELAQAYLVVDGATYGEPSDSEYRITAAITIAGEDRGRLAVAYSTLPRNEGTTPFRDSEQQFLNYVAAMLGGEIERREARSR